MTLSEKQVIYKLAQFLYLLKLLSSKLVRQQVQTFESNNNSEHFSAQECLEGIGKRKREQIAR